MGRAISEKEVLTIRAYEPADLKPQRRTQRIAEMEAFFTAFDESREPASAQEADAVFEEAMRQTRPNYRTHKPTPHPHPAESR